MLVWRQAREFEDPLPLVPHCVCVQLLYLSCRMPTDWIMAVRQKGREKEDGQGKARKRHRENRFSRGSRPPLFSLRPHWVLHFPQSQAAALGFPQDYQHRWSVIAFSLLNYVLIVGARGCFHPRLSRPSSTASSSVGPQASHLPKWCWLLCGFLMGRRNRREITKQKNEERLGFPLCISARSLDCFLVPQPTSSHCFPLAAQRVMRCRSTHPTGSRLLPFSTAPPALIWRGFVGSIV